MQSLKTAVSVTALHQSEHFKDAINYKTSIIKAFTTFTVQTTLNTQKVAYCVHNERK